MNISKDILYIGVNDHELDMFEGQYDVPNGMAYNSYVILDEKVAVLDTVESKFTEQWLGNLDVALGGRKPDYLVVHHMEPDHSSNIENFMKKYPEAVVVGNSKTFKMIEQFFGEGACPKRFEVENGDILELGSHSLVFTFAPMVHWPEVMTSYETSEKVLFSADAFGKFGALDVEEDWACEARRYYFGIVGKYGAQVQSLLKKLAVLDVKTICPLHGPVLNENLEYYIDLYNTWSSYGVETEGVLICYTSVYGHTKKAVELLAQKLEEKGCPKVVVNDLARSDMAECVEDAFRYGKIVLATTTYNAEIFPFMAEFINHLRERNFQNKFIGLIENGSWAPMAARVMKDRLGECKNITWANTTVRLLSAMNDENREEIDKLANELCRDYMERDSESANKQNSSALHHIEYGLYAVTTHDGKKDNGMIVNTVTQVASNPTMIAVNINKANYTHEVVEKTGVLNVNCLSVDAPFSIFERLGFKSGRDTDKFAGMEVARTDNGLVILPRYINSCLSLKVEKYVDMGSHGMFICSVTESREMSNKPTMTYDYYHNNVKPKPETEGKKGYVCKICGYVHEGELPEDFQCPLCKHPASDFEPVE